MRNPIQIAISFSLCPHFSHEINFSSSKNNLRLLFFRFSVFLLIWRPSTHSHEEFMMLFAFYIFGLLSSQGKIGKTRDGSKLYFYELVFYISILFDIFFIINRKIVFGSTVKIHFDGKFSFLVVAGILGRENLLSGPFNLYLNFNLYAENMLMDFFYNILWRLERWNGFELQKLHFRETQYDSVKRISQRTPITIYFHKIA